MYKSLKVGWLPYGDLCQTYKIKADQYRFIKKIPMESKEKIGKTWVVKEKVFLAISKTLGYI